MRETTEYELVDRMRAGDQSAVGDLAADYGPKVFQLAYRYTRNYEDAEEVAQDVLLKVYQKIDAFRGDAALSSWIYRITFNTVMSRLRRDKASREAMAERDAVSNLGSEGFDRTSSGEVADWSGMADDEVLRGQLRTRLVRALRALPSIYRLPILLRDIHGLSTEEASAVLRIKEQTLKSRLHRGRLILRERLSDFADGLTLHRPTPARRASRGSGANGFSTRH
jgi:RNA polymerase sigma-70 factor (ECF subfamily)